jgi:cytochrome c biogenesis protein CcmG/thiol:disulfide interchange protein DsbE
VSGYDDRALPMRRVYFLTPLLIFLGLGAYFWVGLGKDPNALPSVLLDQTVPAFALPPIEGRSAGLASTDLVGEVALVNVFGSWCVACRTEHPFLMALKTNDVIPIYGINWREKDRSAGPAWLARLGDPYSRIGDDPHSVAAIAFGVTGAPETFIVGTDGVIRYKHTGPLTPEVWESRLWPIIVKLRGV